MQQIILMTREAKSLLDEAGVKNLSLTLRTLNNQERILASQIIQANLAAIGITAEILPQDSGPFWDMGQEKKGDTWKDLEIWLMRFGAGPDPYGQFQWFVRDQWVFGTGKDGLLMSLRSYLLNW